MSCRFEDLCNKEVIEIESGARIGYVYDIDIDIKQGNISSLIASGSEKSLSFRKSAEFNIPWSDIVVMGKETVLVRNVKIPAEKVKESAGIFSVFHNNA